MKLRRPLEILWLMVILGVLGSDGRLSCRDEANNEVDWSIVYKRPKKCNSCNGYHYYYMTSETLKDGSDGWIEGSRVIGDPLSIWGATLGQVYNSYKKLSYVQYSDQPPDDKAKSNRAHAKGVVVMDSEDGFFFRHSCPKWPAPFNEKYKIPSNLDDNGQNSICVNFKGKKCNFPR